MQRFCSLIRLPGDNGAMNPIANNDGPHYRVIAWVSFTNRITGWGYYKDGVPLSQFCLSSPSSPLADIFWDETWAAVPNPARPRISAALLREGFEDYEYLYMAN